MSDYPTTNKFGLQPGDILVQSKGFPWVQLSKLFTGHPYPHARIVSRTKLDGTVMTYEDIWRGISETELSLEELENYEVWRPNCIMGVNYAALDWIKARLGQCYGYGRLIEIIIRKGGKLPYPDNWDDDLTKDDRQMVCSELIAMAFYRSSYDLVPKVSNRETMPWDMRNPDRLTRIM